MHLKHYGCYDTSHFQFSKTRRLIGLNCASDTIGILSSPYCDTVGYLGCKKMKASSIYISLHYFSKIGGFLNKTQCYHCWLGSELVFPDETTTNT